MEMAYDTKAIDQRKNQ